MEAPIMLLRWVNAAGILIMAPNLLIWSMEQDVSGRMLWEIWRDIIATNSENIAEELEHLINRTGISDFTTKGVI